MSNPIIAKTGEDRYCLVKPPEDAKDFALHYSTHWTNDDVQKLVFSSEIQDPLKCGGDMLHLPSPGNWRIVGIGRELIEENLTDIIPEMKVGNRFSNYNGDYPIWYYSRRESLFSWLRSHGADESFLILKDNG